MKKSLIALAVAGLVSAPAFAATANVDVYGVVNVAIQDTDVTNSDIQVTDNFSRIGFKGSEDLGGGLKAVWQIETGLGSGSDGMGTNPIGTRNTFVGLAGGFGTALMGRHDTPYKIATGKYDIFADTIADYNLGRLDGVSLVENTHDHRSPNAIAYISPSFSGLTIAAAVVATNSAANLNSGDSFDAVSIAAMYANGPLTVDLAYQNVEVVDNRGMKLGVGYTMGDTKFGFVYEDTNADAAGVRDGKSWLVNVAHAMGPITLKASYGQVDTDAVAGVAAAPAAGCTLSGAGAVTCTTPAVAARAASGDDQDMWALGADYALSKRTNAYIVYATGDNDAGSDVSGWNIGVRHSF